jgi:hypothetical protein
MEPKVFLNHTISEVIGGRVVEGNKFGLELELEGRNVGLQDVAVRGWQRHADGSLRGESVEYVTSGAKDLDETKKSIIDLFKKFKDNKVKFNDSIRTSTHVHLNFTTKKVKDAVNFFSLFTLLEEVLQYYSGEDRKGNLFCISSREAEGIIGILAQAIARSSLDKFAGDRYKYAACNLSTLYKFGTIEVRTMKGATSAEQITAWVDILNNMYTFAQNMVSPGQLITDLSQLGAETLMKRVFSPDNYRELMLHWPAGHNLHYSLMEGARLLQVFAYEFDEAFRAEVKIEPQKNGKGKLPVRILEGANAGRNYTVYTPRGNVFTCLPRMGVRAFFNDGDVCRDDERIYWNAARQRFCVNYPDDIYECSWAVHHAIANEAAKHLYREWPAAEVEPMEEEPDWEPDFDEDEEGDED